MANKNKIISVIVLVVVLVAVGAFFVGERSAAPEPAATPAVNSSTATNSGTSPTRAPAPVDVTVPGQGQTTTPDVAAPQVVAPASSHSNSSFRSFSIQADGNKFTPDTIIVNLGDVVNIVITAVDKSYDFTQPDYGLKQTIPEGQSKSIQFGATATGQFTFYCASCGGPSAGPTGYIVVSGK
jgi:heme/copper-type cytochrome/quinol oxidase subunit 2